MGLAGLTITIKSLSLLIPQLFSAETLIFPLTALIVAKTVIELVSSPAVIVQPDGMTQLYVNVFAIGVKL